jgi:hypothetical protein
LRHIESKPHRTRWVLSMIWWILVRDVWHEYGSHEFCNLMYELLDMREWIVRIRFKVSMTRVEWHVAGRGTIQMRLLAIAVLVQRSWNTCPNFRSRPPNLEEHRGTGNSNVLNSFCQYGKPRSNKI